MDAAVVEAGPSDAHAVDGGALEDSATSDAELGIDSGIEVDSGANLDAGTEVEMDSGVPIVDSGIADSGVADSGVLDSGVPDSGVVDSGVADSGVATPPMSLTSADITAGVFPLSNAGSFGCGGSDLSPALSWTAGPAGTQSYAVVMRDLTVNYLHWTIYNLPSSTLSLVKGVQLFQKLPNNAPGTQAKNDSAFYGYQGPCPLAGPSTHSYEISVYALDRATLTSSADSPTDVLNEIAAHLACPSGCKATLTASFTKN